jgi:hypothetical protein
VAWANAHQRSVIWALSVLGLGAGITLSSWTVIAFSGFCLVFWTPWRGLFARLGSFRGQHGR